MSILSFNSCSHLLEKCKKENLSLSKCKSHPEYDYLVFNLVISLNHLFEWFLKDEKINDDAKIQCIKKFNPFQEGNVNSDFRHLYRKAIDIDSPKINQYQLVLRRLCNNAKHFKNTKIEVQNKHYTCCAGDPHMVAGSPDAVAGNFDHYSYLVEINDVQINLEEIIQVQLDNWINFIENLP